MRQGPVGEADVHQLAVIHSSLLLDCLIVQLLIQIPLCLPVCKRNGSEILESAHSLEQLNKRTLILRPEESEMCQGTPQA